MPMQVHERTIGMQMWVVCKMKPLNLIGKTFGYLTVIERRPNDKHRNTTWLCKCTCGKTKVISGQSLRKGYSKSCGCKKSEMLSKANTKHGMKYSPTYNSWLAMKKRCNNPVCDHYYNYGAKGIKVCEEWNSSFICFLHDMGKRPQGKTLDKIDNSKGYYKENCKWSTDKQQRENRTDNCMIEYKGRIQTCKQWSDETGIKYDILNDRFNRGDRGDRLFRPEHSLRVSSITVNYNGKTYGLSEFSRVMNVSYSKLYYLVHDKNLDPICSALKLQELCS